MSNTYQNIIICPHLCLGNILWGRFHTIPLCLPTSVSNFLWCRYLILTINSFLCICLPTFTYYLYLLTMNSFLCKIHIDTFYFLFYYYSYVDFVQNLNMGTMRRSMTLTRSTWRAVLQIRDCQEDGIPSSAHICT